MIKKKTLDLGCGKEGNFVKFCIENRITDDIVGLDLNINPEELGEKYKNNFLMGDFDKEIPGENHDLIISVGAMSMNPNPSEKQILSVLKSLKEDGEIRLSPVLNAPKDRGLKGVEDSRKRWQDVMKSLDKKGEIEYQFQPIDIAVSGINKDVILHEVLIIKKKQK